MKFDSGNYPKYNKLTRFEKFILKSCCYYPPKKKRIESELIIDPEKYINTLTNAYGNEFWNLIENKKVLDFGCGDGGFMIGMATKTNCIIDGVDVLPKFDVAKAYLKEHAVKNVNFFLGSSEILETESYDVIISHDSFEHFENPKLVLNEMLRLVKPNGYVLIKFGPTWMGPYGRHMRGTFRDSRPWIHLLIPEKNMMRVHSVYQDDEQLFEKYIDLRGGLNKMTIKRAKKIIRSQKRIGIKSIVITPWKGLAVFVKFPVLKELFGVGVYFKCKKVT